MDSNPKGLKSWRRGKRENPIRVLRDFFLEVQPPDQVEPMVMSLERAPVAIRSPFRTRTAVLDLPRLVQVLSRRRQEEKKKKREEEKKMTEEKIEKKKVSLEISRKRLSRYYWGFSWDSG